MDRMDAVDHVKSYLRGQNLEQLGRIDEAIEQYETAVAAGFDSTGPYDRLITLYSSRSLHAEVMRVIDAALEHVQTHEEKRSWYRMIRSEAERLGGTVPEAAPRRNPA
jgi:hypothetical protein